MDGLAIPATPEDAHPVGLTEGGLGVEPGGRCK